MSLQEGHVKTGKYTKNPYDRGGKIWSDIPASQGFQKIVGNHHQLRRNKEGFLCGVFCENMTLPTPCFCTTSFQICERIIFCCIKTITF